jgi:hypothetical protein
LEAPYFYEGLTYNSIHCDYGWHKLDGGKRWICHHCADHGYSPCSDGEPTFEEWYENVVVPKRIRVRELIKAKDPKYYNECYFYDDPENAERYFQGLFADCEEEE